MSFDAPFPAPPPVCFTCELVHGFADFCVCSWWDPAPMAGPTAPAPAPGFLPTIDQQQFGFGRLTPPDKNNPAGSGRPVDPYGLAGYDLGLLNFGPPQAADAVPQQLGTPPDGDDALAVHAFFGNQQQQQQQQFWAPPPAADAPAAPFLPAADQVAAAGWFAPPNGPQAPAPLGHDNQQQQPQQEFVNPALLALDAGETHQLPAGTLPPLRNLGMPVALPSPPPPPQATQPLPSEEPAAAAAPAKPLSKKKKAATAAGAGEEKSGPGPGRPKGAKCTKPYGSKNPNGPRSVENRRRQREAAAAAKVAAQKRKRDDDEDGDNNDHQG